MKAIVLTCDKYIKLAYHMILTYQKLWPNNPFEFFIPYNFSKPSFLEKEFGENKITLINTNTPIKQTILQLLENISDEEWIYWCIDDKYLINIDHNKVIDVFENIKHNHEIDGFCPIFRKEKLENECINISNITVQKRPHFNRIWLHQFLRAKVLKHLFSNLREVDKAKQLDGLKKKINLKHNLYCVNKNNSLMKLGESTTRGLLTSNCEESFRKYKIQIPENFNISNKKIIIG